ncbi:hypothetical protein MTO98_21105 [Mucilaginibacter sp. SMC90]|uniref:hypothetical protein n=1 Tax=Mucilaginibacter sp. SMC90 TaxID=2929803 RepID=UPI001FB2BE4E|nr:hypothetical protein [Mucilaginibacter sp. SMC90]UOE46906.1 hypothetical protein MTO98_21105 [Mucilaginibacter sp. SMC90]
MMDDNNTPQNVRNENQDKFPGNENKKSPAMKIVGYNLLVLAVYTIICAITNKDGGVIFDMFFIGIQFFACIIFAIINRSWVWLLSAIMVLIIGFSTCVGMLNFSGL